MKLIKYIFIYIFLIALAGCSADDIPLLPSSQSDFAHIEGDKVVVNLSVDAPEIQEAATRALGASPDYNDMHLYLIEFEDHGSALSNTIRKVYTPDEEIPRPNNKLVLYKVTLDKTNQPRILHLIALSKDKELKLDYGVEGSIIPSLSTNNQTPAYWRRLEFKNGYVSQDNNGVETPVADLNQLKHVALVRNFACISVTNNTGGNFILSGFAVVNNPTSGTMAPYKMNGNSFPEFLDGSQAPLSYQALSANYSGIVPAGVAYSNPESNPQVPDDVSPKYVYERPFNSIRHTYIIIKGRRKGDAEDTYYKLDIGKNDNIGVFQYFSILRNFKYNIVINSVATKGSSKAIDAAKGVVYNNFSFDVELSSMLNISDGNEIVYVNFTTAVITNPESQKLTFKYRYRSLSSSTPTYNNNNVTRLGLEPGDVIKSVEIADKDDAEGWREVTIYCHPAESESKQQSFTIVKPSGLGRTINLVLHRKWNLDGVKAFPGILENWNNSTPGDGFTGTTYKSNLTIFFDIPDNLSEALFPLTFTLEADHQNIENNPLGKLVVTYGTSGFINVPEYKNEISGRRIMYQKIVSWTEYNDTLLVNDPYDNGTLIPKGDGTNIHRIRCRFKMITNLSNEHINDEETMVLITNENFNYKVISFKRDKKYNYLDDE